jgi:alkylhydroperoxidase family enzyme
MSSRLPTAARAEDRSNPVTRRISDQRNGRVPRLYTYLLHSERVAEGWLALGTAVRKEAGLPDEVREIVVCLIASMTGASYEWQQHSPLALEAGVTQTQLDALPDWRQADGLSELQTAALGFAEAMVQRRVGDDEVDRLRAVLDEEGTVELAATVTYYIAISHFLQAFAIEADR